MRKIMFVCHGNICRSPMAEYLFKDMVQKAGKANEYEIASSAVSRETIWNGQGEPIYPPAKKLLNGLGIACEEKRSQLLTVEHGEYYDVLYCMDDSNVSRAKRIVGEKNAHKCKKLLSLIGETRDVADPWYTRDFNATYTDLKKALTALFKE
ncbi:MAG: low molecular weight phosphotyrosine protein phosphatase [Clostridia bacterium]|nr:low molecular weight phosphotyrosine protein phosphatase [Clostridia bacterium]